MSELQCQVCHQQVEASHLTLRDVSELCTLVCLVADSLQDMNMWLCCFCWKRVLQCTNFIMTVQQSKGLLSEKNSLVSKNLYSFIEHRLPDITICQMDGCPRKIDKIITEGDMASKPLTQIKQESNVMKIKSEIKHEKEIEVEFVDTENAEAITNPKLWNSDEDESDNNIRDSVEGSGNLPQIHWSDLVSAHEENVKHLGVELIYFTEQQVIEEITKRKEAARYKYAKYRCEDCAYFNIKEEYFTKHRKSKHSEGNHECSMCHYRFMTSSDLEEHRRQHLRRWRCVRCDIVLSKGTWHKHGSNCLPTAQCKCDVCNKIFLNKHVLRRHYVRAHVKIKPQTKQYECTLCNRKYKYQSQLEIHMRTHTGENPFECNQCEMKFISNQNMRLHIRQVHVDHPTEKVYCVQCDRHFRSPEDLDKHMTGTVTHVGKAKHKLECSTCHKKFPNLTLLDGHVRVQHLGTKDYHCPVCKKAFGVERYMKRHLTTRHSDQKPLRNHVCDLCGSAFSNKKFLKDHMTAVHFKLRPYKCNVCGATFGYKAALYTHNKLKHEGKKRGKKSSTTTTSFT